MPTIKSIQLNCTPEEWALLCGVWDHILGGSEPFAIAGVYVEDNPISFSIRDKISAINKRLVFASSIPEH